MSYTWTSSSEVMTLRTVLYILLGLTGALAGCLSADRQPSQTDPSGPCDENGSAEEPCRQPGPRVDSPYLVELSDCEILRHTLEVRNEVYQPEYPPGVEPATQVFGLPVHYAMMNLWTCRQALFAGEVQSDFQLFTFGGGILRPNPQESNVTLAQVLFQAYTNSRSLAENASRAYGIEILMMENVEVQRTPLPTSPFPTFSYSFDVPNGQEADYAVTGHLWNNEQSDWDGVDGYYFLNASKELNHFRINYEGKGSTSSPGTVTFGQGSYWGQRSAVESWDFENHPITKVTARLSFFTGI